MMRFVLRFIFSFITFLPHAFAYDSYDYAPIDGNDYYSNNDGNHDENNQQDEYRSASREKYSKKSSVIQSTNYSKLDKSYVGANKTFIFDPKQLRWFAFYNGNLVNSGRASGGRSYCPDIRKPCKTPSGVFTINHKGGPDCKSSKYPIGKGNAPMPWCMFFRGGFAIHGSWAVPNYNASHGCIRVLPSDARWLNLNFLSPGSKVIVKGYQ